MIFTLFLLDWTYNKYTPFIMESIKLFHLAERYHKLFPKNDMLAVQRNGVMRTYSTEEYIETSNNIGYGLLNIGIKKKW